MCIWRRYSIFREVTGDWVPKIAINVHIAFWLTHILKHLVSASYTHGTRRFTNNHAALKNAIDVYFI